MPAIPATRPARVQFDQAYDIPDSVAGFRIGKPYRITRNDTVYTLFFTRFPIIAISTGGAAAVTDAVTKATFEMADTVRVSSRLPIGINVRGASSRNFPKKSFKIEFWTDTLSRVARDTSLLGMRTDSEWLLLAMYNEAIRVNNVTSHSLWLKMHRLYYLSQEPDALPGIRTRYVDVFVNGSYGGIYALTEPIDRKQLKLKKTRDNGQARGELYKAVDWTDATLFAGVPADSGTDSTWAGFELKYPNTPAFWANLRSLISFVVTSPESTFKSLVSAKWQLDNLVDYFLFLNLIRATDNRGKNVYIARYKENDPYTIIPWDLDGTWGFIWSGQADNTTNDILSNGLYDRLLTSNPNSFRQKLKTRWFSLRSTIFATDALKKNLTDHAALLANDGAYDREATKWPLPPTTATLSYMHQWIDSRVQFLDAYFGAMPDQCANPPVPTLNASSTLVTAGQRVKLTASGCPYTVIWNTGQTGQSLLINPWKTTAYSAACHQLSAGCASAISAPLSITVTPGPNPATQADLSVAMQTDRRAVSVGATTLLTISLTNNGPQTARDIEIQDRLPTDLSFIGSEQAAISHGSGIVTMRVDSLLAHETVPFTFAVKLVTDGTVRNAAQVLSAATYDPDSQPGSGTGDGQDDVCIADIRSPSGLTTVRESPNPNQEPLPILLPNQPAPDPIGADLKLELVPDQLVVTPAATVVLTMVVRNEGGLSATGVAVACTLPHGLTFLSGEGVSSAGGVVVASGLTIPANGSVAVPIRVLVTNLPGLRCLAQVMLSDQPDPDSTPGNGNRNGEDDEAQIELRPAR